ncbi:MAG: hypothetical protein H6704_11495 [Myxococcales bacterium]|nr:hypothetical protein [Myxococcales bacterium]
MVEPPAAPDEGDTVEVDDGQGPDRDAGGAEAEVVEVDDGQGPDRDAGGAEAEVVEVDDGQGPDRAAGGRPEPRRLQLAEPVRFAAGDDRLDARALAALEQAAAVIGAAPAGTSVRVTAVGDDRLSLRRAAVVIDALRRAGVTAPMTARGVAKPAWPGASDIDIVLTEGSPP